MMVPDSTKMDMPHVVATTAKWVRDLEYECFSIHGDKEGVLQLLLGKVARECRFEGQEWQILRQVSPTQTLATRHAILRPTTVHTSPQPPRQGASAL